LEEERRREALREKDLGRIVKEAYDNDCVGDDKDRWTQLIE
jgi:hypothetical protein